MKKTFGLNDFAGTNGYKLTTGLIVPRPIGWVGSVSSEGIYNLAPFSFFNAISGNPPTFVFSAGAIATEHGASPKDTLSNVRESGEFSLNIVTAEVAEAMNQTSATVASEVDEFELAGVTAVTGDIISAPLVAECKANIECQVTQIIHVGDPDGGNHLVIGEAVCFHIDPDLLDGTRVDQVKLDAVGRHVGNLYSRATNLFELVRPH